MKLSQVKEKYEKIMEKHSLVHGAIIIFLILFSAFQVSTVIIAVAQGDPYIFPMDLLAKCNLENEPDFKSYIDSKGYIIKTFSWYTAAKHGDIWEFYIKVQNKPGYKENDIHDLNNYWKYHTNGYVYYNARTREIVFDLI